MKVFSQKQNLDRSSIRSARSGSESGSTFLTTMVFGVVIIIVLMSYMQLLEGRTVTRARTLSWNSAIPILEAGIEEACTHLARDTNTLASNGWTNSTSGGNTIYSKRRDFSDGSYCLVTVSNVPSFPFTAPVIYSQGFVPGPYAVGYISRTVQVMLTNQPVFGKALSAKSFVDMNGQAIVDSFDSSNTNYSNGGLYDSSKHKGNATVVTNSKSQPAIDVGNGHIYGKAITGAGGTVSTTAGGSVGDPTWSASNSGVETGYATDDMNAYYPDQSAPSGSSSWFSLSSGAFLYGGTLYDYSMGNVNRKVSGDFKMGSHDNMVVTGNAALYISGDFSIGAGAWIYIAPGASLTVYVAGATTKMAGGGVVNGTGNASSFSYIGLPNNTSIEYSGNSDFIGTINAPSADVKITGGANFTGAAIVNSYTSKSSNVGFHFDESLINIGPLKLVSYREL